MVRSHVARLALVSLAAISATACGGTATDARAVQVARPVASPRGDAASVAPVDTSQPRDLAVLLRVRNPEDTVDAASALSGTPLSLLLDVAAKTGEAEMLSGVVLAQPIDVAVVVPPGVAMMGEHDEETADGDGPEASPLVAIAFGAVSAARFVEAMPGASVTRPRRDGSIQLATEEAVCAVPGGAGPVRVVCGTSADALRRLGPWMATTLPREPLPAVDAHVTFFAAPAREAIRQIVARELRPGAVEAREELQQLGVTDSELLAVPDVVLDEMEALADDAERLEIALDVDLAARTASARATARFRGSSAWTTRVLADPAARRGPPPAIFWRAPRDADAASWALASSPEHFGPVRRALSKAVSLGMSRAGMTPDETAAVVGAIDGFPSYGGPWASAQGRLPWKMPPQGGATPQNAVADLRDRSRALVGWGVAAVETPAAPWASWVVGVEKAWKKVLSGARRSFAGDDTLADAPDVKVVRAPAGYPRGTVALDVAMKVDSELAWSSSPRLVTGEDGLPPPHPPGPPAKGTMTLRFVVVPDGDRTLLGWSLDDAALRGHVKAMLRDAPASGTIASRPDLKRLERAGTGGGFFSVRPWVDLAVDFAQQEGGTEKERELVTKAVESLPNQGRTPVLTFADGTAGAAPSLQVELLVQEGSIDDLRALGQFAIGQGMQELLNGFGGTGDETLGGPVGIQPPAVSPPPPSPSPRAP